MQPVETRTDATASTPAGTPPLERDVKIRERVMEYVLREVDPEHRKNIRPMYIFWKIWNKRYFEEQMIVPLIFLNEPSEPKSLGDCGPVSGFGCSSQIRIRPSLLAGTHPSMNYGDDYAAGRFRFVRDVLLHEMIHQWQQEVSGQRDKGYHGHGPAFRDKANEIGTKLGLPPVRTCKARGKDKDLPSCSHWPHIVRPTDYYLDAYFQASRDTPEEDRPALCESAAVSLARRFSADEIRTIAEMATRMKGDA